MTEPAERPTRRLGVVVCQCGGNISDYVDTERVAAAATQDADVVATQVQMFACSDAAQQAMVQEIREKKLDGLVVCSCSPKLHLATFRAMADRAGLNPYEYAQVNLREQCSWAHPHDRPGATEKAIRLVRAGVAKTRLSRPLERRRVEAVPQALVVGAGVAGLRAALALADLGIGVHLIDRADRAGGQVARWGTLFPHDQRGDALVDRLVAAVGARANVVLHLRTELVEKTGRVGAFDVTLRTADGSTLPLRVGAIVLATGFEPYAPAPGEFGYGLDGVLTLAELKERLATLPSPLVLGDRPVRSIAYIYCVGSRQAVGPGDGSTHAYCSRYCCSATSHLATVVGGLAPSVRQYHLFRDVRTYGKYEALYERALRGGSLFLRYGEDAPPVVRRDAAGLRVVVPDRLLAGEEVELRPDLVVLVTGMVPRPNAELVRTLKIPVGPDGFFREVHVKLRPVETVVDGIFIVGAAQGPKNVAESVASALAGVSKAGGLLLRGHVDLDPLVARVDPTACVWCGACAQACPYNALEPVADGDRTIAGVQDVLCKGGGLCVPACPKQAISVEGYTDAQITSMIDAMAREVA